MTMAEAIKQHLIDPELCIRCYTCEETCTIGAISHNDDNVVVDASICEQCMDCIAPCPTGSIDNWRVVNEAYSVDEQLEWMELPEQADIVIGEGAPGEDGAQTGIDALLAQARQGASKAVAPAMAAHPNVNLHPISAPVEVMVKGNFRLTDINGDSDVRHIILDLGSHVFGVLEGQSVGITPPGVDEKGKPYLPRLYSISSPRDGERPNVNNLSLTVKRETDGVCSNFICDLEKGDTVALSGPFGDSFLLPDDAKAKLLMICTGTGAAPFRAFTMRRQRVYPGIDGAMKLFFGARSPDSLPYFGPLNKIPNTFLDKHFAFSRDGDNAKVYVQDKLREAGDEIGHALCDPQTHIYICGLKAMEAGVEAAFCDIARAIDLDWVQLKGRLQEEGRYHVETY